MDREVAWRISAREFSDSSVYLPGEGEKSPNYLLTPAGAKVNRILAMGVLVDVENRGSEEDPSWWARISDATGLFFVFAGQYQPDASMVLSTLEPPVFVAVTGKTRVYAPDGTEKVYTSIRADTVTVVDESTRDYWTKDVVVSLQERLAALSIAVKMEEATMDALVKEGVRPAIAEGIILALDKYGPVNVKRYKEMMVACLQSILPEYEGIMPQFSPMGTGKTQGVAVSTSEDDELQKTVLSIVENLDKNPQGAVWDEVVDKALDSGMTIEDLEEAINILIDRGDLYEPALGKIKRV